MKIMSSTSYKEIIESEVMKFNNIIGITIEQFIDLYVAGIIKLDRQIIKMVESYGVEATIKIINTGISFEQITLYQDKFKKTFRFDKRIIRFLIEFLKKLL